MDCEEKKSDDCGSRWLLCKHGLPNIIGEQKDNFRVIMPNVLLTGVSKDISKVYYMFFNNNGAGFFIEIDNTYFNFVDCKELIKGDLLTNINRLLNPNDNIRLLEYIIENVMFPS
ncbi:MAG: hypothetical protein ACP5I6_02845 [Caldisphaera sp.]|jgi:hypothetical protein|nr:MAG: hypothetical protein C0201_02550 [Caldisphaera sp.]PMP90483.1 MAG: hypothetical protein C0171_04850 [Caldisphaera sp.]